MKQWSIICMLLFFVSARAQTTNPYLTLKYDSVVAYRYSPHHDSTYIIDKSGLLNPHVKSRTRLDEATAMDFNTRIGLSESYGGMQAKCFMPGLAFVYYSNGKPVADIIVCLGCNYFVSSLTVPAQKAAKKKGMSHEFKQFVGNLGGQ